MAVSVLVAVKPVMNNTIGIYAKASVRDVRKHSQSNMSGTVVNAPVATKPAKNNMTGVDASVPVAVKFVMSSTIGMGANVSVAAKYATRIINGMVARVLNVGKHVMMHTLGTA